MQKAWSQLKALVWGGGSIGTRHATNLRSLGVTSIDILESDPARVKLLRELGFHTVERTTQAGYDLAIIATPTHLHGEHASEIIRRGIPLFVEKPLAHDRKALKSILAANSRNPVVSLVGCNMRFHPGPACVKKQLLAGAIGQPLFGRVHTGSYLPEWRPSADYRKSYSARSEQGGGVLLDCIHEIDLASWYFGDFGEVFSYADRLSDLDIDVEDYAVLVSKHTSGILSEIHLDYFQRAYSRGCHISGTDGTLIWEFGDPHVRLYRTSKKEWEYLSLPEEWQMNDMYVEELKHFLRCVTGAEQPVLDIQSAIAITEVAIQAREQSRVRPKRKKAA